MWIFVNQYYGQLITNNFMWQLYFILTDLVWFAWPPKIEHLIFKFFWKFAVFSYLNHLKNQIKYVHFCKPILILYLWWLLVYPFKKSLFLKICINSVNSCWSQPNSKQQKRITAGNLCLESTMHLFSSFKIHMRAH